MDRVTAASSMCQPSLHALHTETTAAAAAARYRATQQLNTLKKSKKTQKKTAGSQTLESVFLSDKFDYFAAWLCPQLTTERHRLTTPLACLCSTCCLLHTYKFWLCFFLYQRDKIMPTVLSRWFYLTAKIQASESGSYKSRPPHSQPAPNWNFHSYYHSLGRR